MISDNEILKYLNGNCSQDEAKRLEAWLGSDSANRDYFADMKSIHESSKNLNTYQTVDINKEWKTFTQNIQEDIKEQQEPIQLDQTKSSFKKYIPYAIAASIAVLALVIINLPSQAPEPEIVAVNSAEILIAKTLDKTKEIILADGSSITLLENSELQYPSTFEYDPIRTVELITGAATLDISHNPNKKFLLTSGIIGIEVLGTKFTIRQTAEKEVNIKLMSGAIRAYEVSNDTNSINLVPGDDVNFSNNEFVKINALPKSEITPPTPLTNSSSSIYHLEDVLEFLDEHYGKQFKLERKLKVEKTEEIKIDLNQTDLSNIVEELVKNSELQAKPGKCDGCFVIGPIKKK